MVLVEYIQKRKTEKFNYCSGFYDKQEALDFALKLEQCSNILGVTVSEIDLSFADVIYCSNKDLDGISINELEERNIPYDK